ncbi:MAG: polysaccharide pyruvyl transferase family protein, partial [Promethearchaeota archaeon]
MKERIKVLFTGLLYLNHNYGAQGLSFPMMEKLSNQFNAEYTFVLPQGYPKEYYYSFSEKYSFNVIIAPRLFVILGKLRFPFYLLYLLVKRRTFPDDEKRRHSVLVDAVRKSDVVLDLAGIEFIGNFPLRKRYANYIRILSMQWLAEKHGKLYLKHTKSYGPFPDKDKIYRFLVKKCLNKLPFLFVRGKDNLNEVKKLNLDVPLYSFPDISLSLAAESRKWALNYVGKLGVDTSKSLVGLSPSAVIARMKTKNTNSSCGNNHIEFCKEIIKFYRSHNQQVLLIPHSIVDGKNLRYCDLALARKIYDETRDKTEVFLVDDMDLTYAQVRAIIGLLDFYVTGRYHSISSALFMAVPTVALSWHIKYKDIVSLFLEEFKVIVCRKNSVEKSMALIKEAYFNRQWFDRER